MIELGLACYAIHFAAYQKFGVRPEMAVCMSQTGYPP